MWDERLEKLCFNKIKIKIYVHMYDRFNAKMYIKQYEVAATINKRGDEPYLFRPCWLRPPTVASNILCDHAMLPSEQESQQTT